MLISLGGPFYPDGYFWCSGSYSMISRFEGVSAAAHSHSPEIEALWTIRAQIHTFLTTIPYPFMRTFIEQDGGAQLSWVRCGTLFLFLLLLFLLLYFY